MQLELDLTRTNLELLKLQQELARNTSPKIAAAVQSSTPGGNPTTKPTLKDLHQDPKVQSDLKSLMDSLGEPVLVGLTEEEQDPACQLLEPTSSRGKHIPDFISSFPIILQEDSETVLGTSDDAKIILKSSQEKKHFLDKISFPQWSVANFRIMHILMKDGLLSSTQHIFDYILYSSKISELAKCYPLPKVMQYDDLYRQMPRTVHGVLTANSYLIKHFIDLIASLP